VNAAVYARKSTDDKADAEDKSTARQLANARTFAESQGWTVVGEYVEEAVSGWNIAKLVNRARMAVDAESGKFSVVVARSVDRLSRDDREGAQFVYLLDDAGVPTWNPAPSQWSTSARP
jgi:site-specific DNA recombinase